jgi:arylformamidase
LLTAGVIIVEGLDLSAISPGSYDLYCLPLKLVGSDGAPARVILVE